MLKLEKRLSCKPQNLQQGVRNAGWENLTEATFQNRLLKFFIVILREIWMLCIKEFGSAQYLSCPQPHWAIFEAGRRLLCVCVWGELLLIIRDGHELLRAESSKIPALPPCLNGWLLVEAEEGSRHSCWDWTLMQLRRS